MKKRFVAVLLTAGLGFCATSAYAQSAAPDFPADEPTARAETPAKRPNARATADELRRAAMTPEEQKQDQQLQLLAARTGNTTLGVSGAKQQYDTGSGGFMVRKYQSRTRAGREKRGITLHMMGSANPKGQRLIDKKHKKKFLFF
ncbi:hypothetical protein Q5H93_10325 [Hymenobacter sp. ASUV-10]|uniref:Uncharacterized protein n=1 Tax=Hymenobacter aranciens TaxID=3063996 RepID=A0ABT9BDM4_9BACT|nr:hypothetical protein [Hymenobacter sp. ASUV-10]MDO7875127.1 hypothetical protein [Hymenobacter sp. ASUV-10]